MDSDNENRNAFKLGECIIRFDRWGEEGIIVI